MGNKAGGSGSGRPQGPFKNAAPAGQEAGRKNHATARQSGVGSSRSKPQRAQLQVSPSRWRRWGPRTHARGINLDPSRLRDEVLVIRNEHHRNRRGRRADRRNQTIGQAPAVSIAALVTVLFLVRIAAAAIITVAHQHQRAAATTRRRVHRTRALAIRQRHPRRRYPHRRQQEHQTGL